MARIVFMGTPEFALPSLRRLAHSGHDVAAVYTQPDRPAGRGRNVAKTPVKRAAEELGLPVLSPRAFKAEAAVEELRSFAPQAIVVVAYGRLLPASVLGAAPKGVLNLHPSLLPKYRGPSPIAAAILAGDGVTGATVMLLDEGMDSGPLLAQAEEPIGDDDDAVTLSERLAERGALLVADTLDRWLRGAIEARPQDDAQATYCRLVKKEDGEIDWEAGAIEIWRRLRAYTPWPGVFTSWRGQRLAITAAKPAALASGEPGLVSVQADDEGQPRLNVSAGRDALEILSVKPEGKAEMPAGAFLAGRPDFDGSRLPS